MTITLNVRSVRSGWADLRARLKGFTVARLRVGILRGSTDRGVPLVDVGAWMELGTRDVPARPFIAPTIRAHRREISDRLGRVSGGAIRGEDSRRELDAIGKWLADEIRRAIQDREIPPPLRPKTIDQKRRQGAPDPEHPLIRFGSLLDAISHEVM